MNSFTPSLLAQRLLRSAWRGGSRIGKRVARWTRYHWVPIYALHQGNKPEIKAHLLALSPADRYLRFGYQANDVQINAYVDQIHFERDEIYGVFNRQLTLIAMAHVAILNEPGEPAFAEFGVSVAAHARGRGYGERLFERAVIHARNAHVTEMRIHALSENAPMIHIARKVGATVMRDGVETEAYLHLPLGGLDSQVSELVADQYAKTNYSIKKDIQRFWRLIRNVKEIRDGVRHARHSSGM